MYNIDKSRCIGDTTNMLLSNISEQLQEIITLLKPQEVKEVKAEIKQGFKCSCGKPFETERQLRGHKIKCRGV
jgi:hypothetical protein